MTKKIKIISACIGALAVVSGIGCFIYSKTMQKIDDTDIMDGADIMDDAEEDFDYEN